MQNMLAECLKSGIQPKLQFCKALLAQLKVLDCGVLGSDKLTMALLQDLILYARQIEDEIQVPQVSLLDELGRVVSEPGNVLSWNNGELDFLGFLVRSGLIKLYITEVLKARKSLTQSDKNILLGSALGPSANLDPEMVDILLHHGAQPNGKYEGSLCGRLLHSMDHPGLDAEKKKYVLPIVQSLLFHGANPHERVVIGQKNIAGREMGRDSDSHAHQNGELDITKTAQELLVDMFGEENQTTEVLEKAREFSGRLQKTQRDQVSIPSSYSK